MLIHFPDTFTVESVTSGHPDKVCDQISDAVLDECLRQDSLSRVSVECFGSHGLLVVGGELTTTAKLDVEKIACEVYRDIGYEDDLEIITRIVQQSPDISQGVDMGGAGDQGIMYGYACDDTRQFLPEALVRVHDLACSLEYLRKKNPKFSWARPDGKTQVTVQDGKIVTVLVSTQHDETITQEEIKRIITDHVVEPIIGDLTGIEVLVNPTGKFVQGGFSADAGLTGRKIMVDTYGGLVPHGGGCFSGKDATKVDRSGAYMCRYAAKSIVANGLAKKCLVTVAYAIGRSEPLMLEAYNEKGESLGHILRKHFDFRPKAIIERLDLRKPIYKKTSVYGHFGKSNLPWERVVEIR